MDHSSATRMANYICHIDNSFFTVYPLKGCKAKLFVGDVRFLVFATGGLLPAKMQGKAFDGFIHNADCRYTTFYKLTGVDSCPGKFPVDGLNAISLNIQV